MRAISIIASLLLLLAIARMPIGYYTFLRLAVTIASVIVCTKEYKGSINAWVILFGLTAILYNPVIPVYLYQRSLWIPLNIAGALLFAAYAVAAKKEVRL